MNQLSREELFSQQKEWDISFRSWVEQQSDQNFRALWVACPRGDWSLYLAEKLGVPKERIETVAKMCMQILPPGILARFKIVERCRDNYTEWNRISVGCFSSFDDAIAHVENDISPDVQRKCADLVRSQIPFPGEEKK